MIFGTYLGFADRWVMSTMVCKVRSMNPPPICNMFTFHSPSHVH